MVDKNIVNIGIDAEILRNALDRIIVEDPEATVYILISNEDAKEIIKAGIDERGYSISAEIKEHKYSPKEIKYDTGHKIKRAKFSLVLHPEGVVVL